MLGWGGKFTGLGSAFSELSLSPSNQLLPIHAKVDDVRIFGFVSTNLSSDKALEYVFMNRKFVRWDYLYTFFNQMLIKTFWRRRIRNFKYVICIECSTELTVFRYGLYTPQTRLGQLETVESCLNVLRTNLKIMYRCEKILPIPEGDSTRKGGFERQRASKTILQYPYFYIGLFLGEWFRNFARTITPIHEWETFEFKRSMWTHL